MRERLFDSAAWRPRALATLAFAAGWLPVGLLFRFEKYLALPGDVGWLDLPRFLLPEIAWLVLWSGLWLALAAARGRWAGVLWWSSFGLFQVLFYLFTVVEHSYFMHTGMRLHANLFAYAVAHLDMLGRIIVFGVDDSFYRRLGAAVVCLLVAALMSRRLASRADGLPPGLVPAIWIVGGLLWLVPGDARSQRYGLDRAGLVEFLRPVPQVRDLLRSVPDEMLAAEPYYQPPSLTGSAVRTPNIVLVVLESTGAGSVAPYSPRDAWGTTPFMAELAADSLVFDSAYTTVTHTSKALVGLLCGVPARNVLEIVEASKEPWHLRCLPHLLAELGYRTAFLQSAQGNFEDRPYLVRRMGFGLGAFQETMAREGFERLGYFAMDERVMIDPAGEWIEQGDAPFFVTLLTSATHHPYHVPGLPPPASPEVFPLHYMAAIQYQDRFLAELFARLEATGKMDETLVILVGDHGEAFGEHLRMQHDFVPYEEVVRTPLVLHGLGLLGEARRMGGLRQHVDLMPTVLEILGAPWQGTLPGRSLLSSPGHERVLASCWARGTCLAMREGDRKVVYHYRLRPLEVFDLAADPGETRDLAPGLTDDERRQLELRLLAMWRQIEDSWASYEAGD